MREKVDKYQLSWESLKKRLNLKKEEVEKKEDSLCKKLHLAMLENVQLLMLLSETEALRELDNKKGE